MIYICIYTIQKKIPSIIYFWPLLTFSNVSFTVEKDPVTRRDDSRLGPTGQSNTLSKSEVSVNKYNYNIQSFYTGIYYKNICSMDIRVSSIIFTAAILHIFGRIQEFSFPIPLRRASLQATSWALSDLYSLTLSHHIHRTYSTVQYLLVLCK